jgi:hypothetical protein
MTKRKPRSKKSKTGIPQSWPKHDQRRKQRNRERAAALEAGLLGKTRPPQRDRHKWVALTLASLIAGLLLLINCDRVTNAQAAAAQGGDVSLHGWPLVYLERRYESLPAYLIAKNDCDWPFPPVEGEIREMNYRNLLLDVLISVSIVLVCYVFIRWIVFRYDRWKKTWSEDTR